MGKRSQRSLFRELGGRGREAGETSIDARIQSLERKADSLSGSVNDKNRGQALLLRQQAQQLRDQQKIAAGQRDATQKAERRKAEIQQQKQAEIQRKENIKKQVRTTIQTEAKRRGVDPQTLGLDKKGRVVNLPKRQERNIISARRPETRTGSFTTQVRQVPPRSLPPQTQEAIITPIGGTALTQTQQKTYTSITEKPDGTVITQSSVVPNDFQAFRSTISEDKSTQQKGFLGSIESFEEKQRVASEKKGVIGKVAGGVASIGAGVAGGTVGLVTGSVKGTISFFRNPIGTTKNVATGLVSLGKAELGALKEGKIGPTGQAIRQEITERPTYFISKTATEGFLLGSAGKGVKKISPVKVETLNLPTATGEIKPTAKFISFGTSTKAKPVVGISEGRLFKGTPEVKLDPKRPLPPEEFFETPAKTEIIKKGLRAEGATQPARQIEKTQELLRSTSKTRSSFTVDKFLTKSKTLSPSQVKKTVEFIRKERGQVKGSFAQAPQVKPELRREFGDIDIILKTSEAKGASKVKALAEQLSEPGRRARVAKGKSNLIEIEVSPGRFEKGLDIKFKEDLKAPIGSESAFALGERPFGFSAEQRPIKIEGVRTQRLSEQGVRKAKTISTPRTVTKADIEAFEPLGFKLKEGERRLLPETFRRKDIRDFINVQETLVESKRFGKQKARQRLEALKREFPQEVTRPIQPGERVSFDLEVKPKRSVKQRASSIIKGGRSSIIKGAPVSAVIGSTGIVSQIKRPKVGSSIIKAPDSKITSRVIKRPPSKIKSSIFQDPGSSLIGIPRSSSIISPPSKPPSKIRGSSFIVPPYPDFNLIPPPSIPPFKQFTPLGGSSGGGKETTSSRKRRLRPSLIGIATKTTRKQARITEGQILTGFEVRGV